MNNVSNKSKTTDLEITRASHLVLVEILFGSLGHGFKIPFTGQFLSLYQLNVLALAINKDQLSRSSVVEISGIVSVLKSLSPAGQKLGPMLSILMQGILFWFGLLVGRTSLFGQLSGAFLLAIWSFVQPFLTYTVIFGFDFYRMIKFYLDKSTKEYSYASGFLITFLLGLILLKVILAWAVILRIYFKKAEWVLSTDKAEALMIKPYAKSLPTWKKALKDILNPLFLVSLVLMLLFIWQIETNFSRMIWLSLRPLALAYVVFYFLRSPLTYKFFLRLAERSKFFNRFYQKAILILQKIEEKRELSQKLPP